MKERHGSLTRREKMKKKIGISIVLGMFFLTIIATNDKMTYRPDHEFGLRQGPDDDGDGLIDYGPDDGGDGYFDWKNDGDGPAIFDDDEAAPICRDCPDDDGDGLIDWPNDLGYGGAWDDPDELENKNDFQASLGQGPDNDGDGLIDWPNDPGINIGLFDEDEADPMCSDDFNNDGYGFTDCPNLDEKNPHDNKDPKNPDEEKSQLWKENQWLLTGRKLWEIINNI